MKLILDNGQEVTADPTVWRRIFGSARNNLERLEREEGRQFPRTDRQALKLATEVYISLSI